MPLRETGKMRPCFRANGILAIQAEKIWVICRKKTG